MLETPIVMAKLDIMNELHLRILLMFVLSFLSPDISAAGILVLTLTDDADYDRTHNAIDCCLHYLMTFDQLTNRS